MHNINGDQLKLFIKIFLLSIFILGNNALEKDGDTELVINSVQGGLAALPCATTARAQISLIIWFRSNSEVPIYTIDLRATGAHKHTSKASRLKFDLDRRILYVHNVSRALDEGRFRCRVDYRKHRSENTFFLLNVTIAPKSVLIMDSEGQKLEGVIGPFKENSNLKLICEAEGGDPPPKLLWYRDNTSLKATSSIHSKFVRSELRLRNLTRLQLGTIYTCVSNTKTIFINASVQLDLNLKPLNARISLQRSLGNDSWSNFNNKTSNLKKISNSKNYKNKNHTFISPKSILIANNLEKNTQTLKLIEEQLIEVYCEVIGSRPTPIFTWYLDDKKLPTNTYTHWPQPNSRGPLNLPSFSSTISSFNSNSAQSVPVNYSRHVNSINLNDASSTSDAFIFNQHLSTSTLLFKPTADADKKQLICRAENSHLNDHRLSFIEQNVNLDVQYAPKLRMKLGANLRQVRELTDVYFECEVNANPKPNEQITWYFLREPYLSFEDNLFEKKLNENSTKQSIINQIFKKHVSKDARALQMNSLLFLDANAANNWKTEQEKILYKLNSQKRKFKNYIKEQENDKNWHFKDQSQEKKINYNQSIDQLDLKFFELVLSSNGVIITDYSLVLQKVQRTQRGLYICSTANSRGRAYSKPIFLDVKYSPVCVYDNNNSSPIVSIITNNQESLNTNELNSDNAYYVHQNLKNENSIRNPFINNTILSSPVKCSVNSFPNSNLKFHWVLSFSSNTANSPINQRKLNELSITDNKYLNESSIFLLQDNFFISSHRNAQLLCWAENEIGVQTKPCVYNIIKAGPPEPLKSCTVSNETTKSVLIYCLLGNNGGLESKFNLEVFDGDGQFVAGQSTTCNTSKINNYQLIDKEKIFTNNVQNNYQSNYQNNYESNSINQRNRIVFLTSGCNIDKAEAVLLLSNLEAQQQYTLVAYAENIKGRSESLKFTASTVDLPAKHTAFGDKQTPSSIAAILGLFICLIGFGLCIIPIVYVWKRIRRNRLSENINPKNLDIDKQQSVATVGNYLTENINSVETFSLEKFDSEKIKVSERPLQTSPNDAITHVSFSVGNQNFVNELTGLNDHSEFLNSDSPLPECHFNQLPLVDYYTEHYSTNGLNQWQVANNTSDPLFMQLEEPQLNLIKKQTFNPSHQNNQTYLINTHQMNADSLYTASNFQQSILNNEPNIELSKLKNNNLFYNFNKGPNTISDTDLLTIPQSASSTILRNTHQITSLNKLPINLFNDLKH